MGRRPAQISHGGSQGFKSPHLHPTTQQLRASSVHHRRRSCRRRRRLGPHWGHARAARRPGRRHRHPAGSPESENEDWAGVAAPGLAVVLDGLSAPDGTGTGCRHGTPWFVSQLGPRLLTLAADPANSPADVLAEAIRQVAGLHPGCDLTHPGTPFSHPGHAPRPGGGIWPDGAGMPDPQPHPPHQPTGTCAELGLSGAGDSRRAVPRLPARAGECWHGESSA
jgi:hypothetical protein